MSVRMDRRRFLRGAGAIGAAGGFSRVWAKGPGESQKADTHARAGRTLPVSTLVVNGLDPSNLDVEYLDLLKAGGVHCWHQTLGDGLASFASLLEFCDAHSTRIAQARSVREIRELYGKGILAHVSGWQFPDAIVVDGQPRTELLRVFQELGLRICSLTYNVANAFGGGCLDPQVGLTRAGHRLVEEIHRSRIVLDVAGHNGEQTSFDAIAMSAGVPVICSHTNVRALNDNPRCSTDRMLEAIARTGGVIGLSAFNDFHARKASDVQVLRTPQVGLDRHLDQYDYLKRLVGVDHIGLGPDFIQGRNEPGQISGAQSFVMAPEAYSPQTPWLYVKGFESIGELPNVAQGLLGRGWSVEDVRKVLGENWLRVYEKVWGS